MKEIPSKDRSIFPGVSHRDEMVALNCPKVGDIWSELMANQIYICAIDGDGVKVLLVWGGGRRAYLFENIGDFQEWIMYDSAGSNGIKNWCWPNFKRNDIRCIETPTWESQWNDQAIETGVEHPNDSKVKM